MGTSTNEIGFFKVLEILAEIIVDLVLNFGDKIMQFTIFAYA